MNGEIVVQATPAAAPAPGQAAGGGALPDVAMAATDPIGAAVPVGIALLVLAAIPTALLLRRRAVE